MEIQTIQQTLKNLKIGQLQVFRNLSVRPLINETCEPSGYLTLDKAIGSGLVQITEISAGGSVPELKLCNDADKAILLLDGEELVGAKQNRVLNLTILAPPKSEIVLPVSCVEAGRWRNDAPDFRSSPRAHFAEGRASKLRAVSLSMCETGQRRSDQSDVWEGIANKAARLDAHSETGAMSDIYEHHEESLHDYVRAFESVPNQVGSVFGISGKIVGLDLFQDDGPYRSYAEKLIRSYALDALDRPNDTVDAKGRGTTEVMDFISAIGGAKPNRFEAVGVGTDVRLRSSVIDGAGLIADGKLVHLAVFTRPGAGDRQDMPETSRMVRPSRRRRFQ